MTPVPTPIFTRPITLGCEIDPMLNELAASFDDVDLIKLHLSKKFKGREIQLIAENSLYTSCWILHVDDYPVSLPDAKKARLILARASGRYPAACYDFLPDYYNKEFAVRHRSSFDAACFYLRLKCVRPSHLSLRTRDGRRVPTLLSS